MKKNVFKTTQKIWNWEVETYLQRTIIISYRNLNDIRSQYYKSLAKIDTLKDQLYRCRSNAHYNELEKKILLQKIKTNGILKAYEFVGKKTGENVNELGIKFIS
jgi:hypothetical protein